MPARRSRALALLLVVAFAVGSSDGHSLSKVRLPELAEFHSPRKVSELEMELQSLQEPVEESEFFEELSDIDQQRHEPDEADDTDDKADDIVITTLIPTTMTEEETRVDEPTDKGPTEPTKENGVTLPTGTTDDSSADQDLRHFLSGVEATTSTVASDNVSGEIIKSELPEEDASAELEMIKDEKPSDEHSDDLITATSAAREHSAHGLQDKGTSAAESEENLPEENPSNNITSPAPKQILSSTKSDHLETLTSDNTERPELFLRNARKFHGHPSNSHNDEDLLEMMIKMAEKPGNWHKITDILGKLDYETSSKLKTALQMKAVQEKNRKENREMGSNTVDEIKPPLQISDPPKNDFQPKENNIHKLHKAVHHFQLPQVSPTKFHSLKNEHNKFKPGLKDLSHVKDSSNMHLSSPIRNLKLHLKNPVANPILPKVPNKNFKQPQDLSSKIDLHHYNGPINTIAIDVPGTGIKPNSLPQNNKNNKQAYIAVTVYKPNKENFHQVNLKPKPNSSKLSRFQEQTLPLRKEFKDYAVEKPVTFNSPNGFSGKSQHVYNHDLKGKHRIDNKIMKSNKHPKYKNKNGGQGSKLKSKHPGKWKHKSQTATDEMEAQLIALSMMEKKLKQHLMQKERLRQRLRMKHHGHRVQRGIESFM